MNRKIEDIKLNNKRILRGSEESFEVKESAKSDKSDESEQFLAKSESKYDFLDKRIKRPTQSRVRFSQTPQMPNAGRPFNKKILFAFVLALIVGIFYLLSTVFLSANVAIIAKNKSFDLKHLRLTAGKSKIDSVPFELMIVSDKEYKDVVLTNSKEVTEKAKGQITLYNEYSTKVQKIMVNSFISDENGKTYKTDTAISIPGYSIDESKKIIPGQVDVNITAFLPGEAYNGNPESFTFNAFKGTDKYKKIYGKAKTSISGGIVGLVYLLDEKEKANISLKTTTSKEKILRKLSAQVPVGYILYPNAMDFSYEFDDSVVSKTPDTKIEINGILSAYILKESDLSKILINKLLPDIGDLERSEILPPQLSLLSFNFVNKDQLINKEVGEFEFELTGSLPLNWMPDIDLLKGLLVGKNKNEAPIVFKQDPGISSASVSIMPFWSKILPKDIKNINIMIKKFDEK